VVSGVLLALAYPPADLGPLALVALVPLVWAWRDATPLGAARDGFVFALAFLGILMAGVTKTGYTGTVSLIVAAGFYYAATGALVAAFARRGIGAPWLTAAVWVFFEGLRGRWPLGGLAWGEIGIALHNVGSARALASFGGVALVSFVVVALNGLVVDLLVAARRVPSPSPRRGWSRCSRCRSSPTPPAISPGTPVTSGSRCSKVTVRKGRGATCRSPIKVSPTRISRSPTGCTATTT
jgi:apolipoprotein N-acyltransferase